MPILQFSLAMKALLYPTDSPSFTSWICEIDEYKLCTGLNLESYLMKLLEKKIIYWVRQVNQRDIHVSINSKVNSKLCDV